MKIIYWRWKGEKTINKDYIQKDLGNMFELTDKEYGTNYPTRVLKKDIQIIIPKKRSPK